MTNAKKLSAAGLNKSFRHRRVVVDVNINFKMGEVVGLLGPNGAGKTTCFYMIVGLIVPDSGTVSIDGKNITALPVYQRARIGVGYLPQEASVFRDITVRENIEIVLEENGTPLAQRRKIVSELLEEFGLEKLANVYGYALSGGERRRVEIARTLAIKPDFILLDEPFAGIDPIAIYDIQQIIVSLKQRGYGIMITDHNVRDTLAITDRAYLIHRGEIMVQGTPAEVAESEIARKYYLGNSFTF
ncbi:MAG: LPS export ABC transporter ATP-binding protein [Pyramidobacter sp.]|nr:LPS export ABC transporter ATP-binding protein [Pyramidobacter sp.]